MVVVVCMFYRDVIMPCCVRLATQINVENGQGCYMEDLGVMESYYLLRADSGMNIEIKANQQKEHWRLSR